LIVREDDNVRVFNTISERFSQFELLGGHKNIKSVNYFPKNGQLIYTVAEDDWWIRHINCKNPELTLTIDSVKIFKVR